MTDAAVTDISEKETAIFDPEKITAAMEDVTRSLGWSQFMRNLPDVENALKRAVLSGPVEIYETSHDCTSIDLITFYDDITGKACARIEYNPQAEHFMMMDLSCDPLASRNRDLLRAVNALRKYAFQNHWCEFRCVRRCGGCYDMVSGEIEILRGKGEVKNIVRTVRDSIHLPPRESPATA